MPTQRREKESSWVQIIHAVNAPLGFYVLALLIVEAFLGTALIGGGLESGQKTFILGAGLITFVLVVGAVTWIVWSKPENITFDKDAHLKGRSKEVDRAEEIPDTFSNTESSAAIEAFWKTNGQVDRKNEKKLKTWLKNNGLDGLPIVTFLIGERWESERIKASEDLKIPKQLSVNV